MQYDMFDNQIPYYDPNFVKRMARIEEYGVLWENQMRDMTQKGKTDFLKKLVRAAEYRQMHQPVICFLGDGIAKEDEAMKTSLKDILYAADYWANSSSHAAYIVNSTYMDALKIQHDKSAADKSLLPDDDVEALAAGLLHMDYAPAMHDYVQEQSAIITAIDFILRDDAILCGKDWDMHVPGKKADYLTRLSRATDYAFAVQFMPHWDVEKNIPPVTLADVVNKNNATVNGCYYVDADRIVLRDNMNYARSMDVFRHEKAHQLSRRIHRDNRSYSSGVLPYVEYHIYDLSLDALNYLEMNSNKKAYGHIYANVIEERLARSAERAPDEIIPYIDKYLKTIEEIFQSAPSEYAYMKDVFGRRAAAVRPRRREEKPIAL